MGYGKVRRQMSRRERILKTNAYTQFIAAAADKPVPAQLLQPVPKKREIRRPVDGRPVGLSEHQEQCAVISWWGLACAAYGLPTFALFAIPNGGARDVITGARLKAEGVRRGVLDLCLAKPTTKHHGLYIEMKAGANKPSPEQQAYIEYLTGSGYQASVHWSAESAINAIKEYLA